MGHRGRRWNLVGNLQGQHARHGLWPQRHGVPLGRRAAIRHQSADFAEISRSSAAYDLHQKLDLFEEARIPEYLAVLLYEQEIRWRGLVRGKYKLLTPDADGIWRSRIFPGLWLVLNRSARSGSHVEQPASLDAAQQNGDGKRFSVPRGPAARFYAEPHEASNLKFEIRISKSETSTKLKCSNSRNGGPGRRHWDFGI